MSVSQNTQTETEILSSSRKHVKACYLKTILGISKLFYPSLPCPSRGFDMGKKTNKTFSPCNMYLCFLLLNFKSPGQLWCPEAACRIGHIEILPVGNSENGTEVCLQELLQL